MNRFIISLILSMAVFSLVSGCSLLSKKGMSDRGGGKSEQESLDESGQAQDIDLQELKKLQKEIESANQSITDTQSVENSLDSAGNSAASGT